MVGNHPEVHSWSNQRRSWTTEDTIKEEEAGTDDSAGMVKDADNDVVGGVGFSNDSGDALAWARGVDHSERSTAQNKAEIGPTKPIFIDAGESNTTSSRSGHEAAADQAAPNRYVMLNIHILYAVAKCLSVRHKFCSCM